MKDEESAFSISNEKRSVKKRVYVILVPKTRSTVLRIKSTKAELRRYITFLNERYKFSKLLKREVSDVKQIGALAQNSS